MAGFTPRVGDILQIRTVCYTATQIAMNVLHYRVSALVNVGLTLDQIATAFSFDVAGKYKALMSSISKYRGVGVCNLMPPRTVEYVSTAHDGPGLGTTGNVPTQTSYIIRNRGNLAGRQGVGHIYPGFPRLDYSSIGGTPTAAAVADLTQLAEQLGPTVTLEQGASTTIMDLIIRNKDTQLPLPQTPTGTPVFQMYPATIFATQRRRGSFGASNIPPF